LQQTRLLDRLLIVSTFGDIFPSPNGPEVLQWKHTLINAINSDLGTARHIEENQVIVLFTKGYSFIPGGFPIDAACNEQWWFPLHDRFQQDLTEGSATLAAIDARQTIRNQSTARKIFWSSFAAIVGVPFVCATVALAVLTGGLSLPLEAVIIGAIVAPTSSVLAVGSTVAGVSYKRRIIEWLAERHPAVDINIPHDPADTIPQDPAGPITILQEPA